MPNRTSTFASAVIMSCLAGAAFAAPKDSAAPAASEECLAGPKGATPAGRHWYYRVERGTKRKCWYLGDAGMKTKDAGVTTKKIASPKPVAASEPPAAKAEEPSIARSTANARAEAPPANAAPGWPAAKKPVAAQADPFADGARATAKPLRTPTPDAATQTSVSPWPEPPVQLADAQSDSDADNPAPIAGDPATTGAISTSAQGAAPSLAAPTPNASTPNAAATPMQSAESAVSPLRIMFGALVLLLGLAVIIGRLIFLYAGKRRAVRVDRRRDIWANVPSTNERTPPSFPRMTTPPVRMRTAREPLEAGEAIEDLLRRAARRAGP